MLIKYKIENRKYLYDIKIRQLQLKIDNFYSEIRKHANNNLTVYIYSDEEKLFKKCREIWSNITESIGINNPEILLKLLKIMMMNILRQS